MKKSQKNIPIEKFTVVIILATLLTFLYIKIYPEYVDYRMGKNVEYESDFTGLNKRLFDHCWLRYREIHYTQECFCKPYVASIMFPHPRKNDVYKSMVNHILGDRDLNKNTVDAADIAYRSEPILANIAFKNCSAFFDSHVKKELFLGFIK